jgi:hypothetical protein
VQSSCSAYASILAFDTTRGLAKFLAGDAMPAEESLWLQSLEAPIASGGPNLADVKPEDEVSLVTKVGAYAGMAAAGLGAATLMGGLAVDVTDMAIIAGLYGVATAVGSSQSSAIRAKGAAGPMFSALLTAADIAKRISGGSRKQGSAEGSEKGAVRVKPRLGKYEKSTTADVSTAREEKEREREREVARAVAQRAEEMREQLGTGGMQALEDGVNQVMSQDVERILQVRHRGNLLSI